MIFRVPDSLDTEWWLFEGTAKVNGTGMGEHNHNRNIADAAGLAVTHTPDAGADGSEIHHERFGNDAGPPGNSSGGAGANRGTQEWILKQNERYLLRVTSRSANNNISIVIDWYENTNKD